MSTIMMQFSADEAIVLMRVLAIGWQKATNTHERDDLEILHGRIYDQMFRSQRKSLSVASRPLSHTDQNQAWRELVTPQSWREWHPSLTVAA